MMNITSDTRAMRQRADRLYAKAQAQLDIAKGRKYLQEAVDLRENADYLDAMRRPLPPATTLNPYRSPPPAG